MILIAAQFLFNFCFFFIIILLSNITRRVSANKTAGSFEFISIFFILSLQHSFCCWLISIKVYLCVKLQIKDVWYSKHLRFFLFDVQILKDNV